MLGLFGFINSSAARQLALDNDASHAERSVERLAVERRARVSSASALATRFDHVCLVCTGCVRLRLGHNAELRRGRVAGTHARSSIRVLDL